MIPIWNAKSAMAVAFSFLLLSGCSTPDNSEPPAELTQIDNPLKIQRLYVRDAGEGVSQEFMTTQPFELDGYFYTVDTLGVITRYESKTGHSLWQFETGINDASGINGNDQGLVITSRNGDIARFDFHQKSLLKQSWKQVINSEIRNRATVSGQQLFIRTVDGKVISMSLDTGREQWAVTRRVPALSLTGISYPIVAGELLISGFDSGKLVAFDRNNGSTVWETTITAPSGRSEIERLVDLDGQFLFRDGVIYVSSYQGNLAAITVSNGQVIWSRKFSSYQSMDIDDQALYLSDDRSHLWSIDRRTGTAFWSQDVLNARKITAPRLIGDHLVVGDFDGYVHWFDKTDGKLLARFETFSKRFLSQPLAINDTVILIDNTMEITAFQTLQ